MADCLEFGEFRLEIGRRQLLRNGEPLRLTPRAFDLLQVLVENRTRVVSKDELLQLVWNGAIVEESNLTQHVFVLRKLLADNQETPKFIATVPRRGYRFVGDVREIAAPGAASTAAANRRISAAWIAAAVMLLALSGLLIYSLGSARVEPPTFRALTFRHRGIGQARFTPDGRGVVLDAQWDGNGSQLYMMSTADQTERPLGVSRARVLRLSRTEAAVLINDGASPDGPTLSTVGLSGGEPRKLMPGIRAADWAPEVGRFAVVRRSAGRTRLEYPAGTVLYETSARIDSPKISPNRELVAFLEFPVMGESRGRLAIVDRQGARRVVSADWSAVYGLTWNSDDEVWYGHFDGRVYALTAIDLSSRERDLYRGPSGLILQDVTADGRALVTQFSYQTGIQWRPPGSDEQGVSKFSVSRASALSADGRTIAFTVEDEGPEWADYATYLHTSGAAAPIRLGAGSAQDLSPDGRSVLVVKFSRPSHLSLLPSSGGPPRDLPTLSIEQYHRAAFLPDGDRIVFAGNEHDQGVRLYVQRISGGAPAPITPEGYVLELDGVSTDGSVVLCSKEGGPPALCRTDRVEITPLRGISLGDKVIRWSDDSRALYVYRRGTLPLQIFRVDAGTGQRQLAQEIATQPDDIRDVPQLLMTPDLRAYVYNFIRTANDLFIVEGLK